MPDGFKSIEEMLSERETFVKTALRLHRLINFVYIFTVGWVSAYKYDNFKLRSRPTLYRAVSLRLFFFE